MNGLHTLVAPQALHPVAEAGDDVALLARVLRPYKPHCRYLRSVAVTVEPHVSGGVRVVARCELSIPESCYIDDTGHFNSVEFNICYNQMVYFAIAKAVQGQLLPAFAGWSIEDFWRKQLPDILITRFESCFRRPVNARRFYGEVSFAKTRASAGAAIMLMRTNCRFWDDHGGHCDGHIMLAIVNPPAMCTAGSAS